MKDCLGQEIRVGDEVVHASGTSGGLHKAVVKKITPKKVTVEMHFSGGKYKRDSSVYPDNVVVINSVAKAQEYKETIQILTKQIKGMKK